MQVPCPLQNVPVPGQPRTLHNGPQYPRAYVHTQMPATESKVPCPEQLLTVNEIVEVVVEVAVGAIVDVVGACTAYSHPSPVHPTLHKHVPVLGLQIHCALPLQGDPVRMRVTPSRFPFPDRILSHKMCPSIRGHMCTRKCWQQCQRCHAQNSCSHHIELHPSHCHKSKGPGPCWDQAGRYHRRWDETEAHMGVATHITGSIAKGVRDRGA